ncbi:MAG TPA: glycosyltransferase family 8 protein [Rickettsia endosymbiont of Pyrocoelia pectoralis]|nr:glycosyltransferase family 8 protein [Rickettsia endosymbiont of Pyrocoelia pectoralis]
MHHNIKYILDISGYSSKKLYSDMRESKLYFDLALERLNDKPLSQKDKMQLEKICSFHMEEGMQRLEVAKSYDCLLQLYNDNDATLPEQYKAIKNGSYGLDTLYTKRAAINLAKLIILGYEKEVKELLNIKEDNDFLKYYSGYTKDEISFLNHLISLNIPKLTARCLYRRSLIHLLGKSSFNEENIEYDYNLAAEEIQNVIKLTEIKQDNIVDIALTINDKFAAHAAAVISSSLLNSDLDSFYRFHVVMNPNDPVTKKSMEKLASMKYIRDYSIDFTPFPNSLLDHDLVNKKMKFSGTWPLLIMYKLYFDQLFPNIESILYLDSDIIVLRDLNFFKKIDMKDYITAGSMDTAVTYGVLEVENECNRNMDNSYKNAGVIFFNLKNMREKSGKNMLLEALQSSKCKFLFPEQDLLNVAFHDYMYPLSMRWNFCTHFDSKSPYFSYFILHYAGRKPWIPSIQELWQTDPEKISDINKYYWRYREITPWGNKDFN